MNNRISFELVAYLNDRKAKRLSPATQKFYNEKLSDFLKYCTSHGVITMYDISPEFVRQFFQFLINHNHNPGGQHAYWRTIKTFFRWYAREDEDWHNPLIRVDAPLLTIEPRPGITLEDIQLMIDCAVSQRDRLLVMFLLDSGLRRSEFVALNVGDVDAETGWVTVRRGKGGRSRVAFISSKTRRELIRYLRRRDTNPRAPLWVTTWGDRLTVHGVYSVMRRLSARAGIKCPGLHDFRRAFALSMWRNGCDLVTLQRLMGHSTPAMLARYLAQTGEDLQRVHDIVSPVESLR